MDSFGNLEVIIRIDKDRFHASSPLFPKCKGVGDTREDALRALSQSIGQYISKTATDAFQTVLLSDQYTEILFDSTKDDHEQRRVFTIDPTLSSFQKTLLLRLQSLPDLAQSEEAAGPDIQQLFSPNIPSDTITLQPFSMNGSSMTHPRHSSQSQGDGIVFGFPLSFN